MGSWDFVLMLWAMNWIINPLAVHWSRVLLVPHVKFWFFLSYFCSIPLNDYKLLVCDIQQLLVAVTIHSCSSSGSQYFRIIEDLITLLGFMQTSKMHRTQGEDWICKIHSKHIGVAVNCALQFICLISSCPIVLHKETHIFLSSLTVEWKHLEGGEENVFKKYFTSHFK